MSETREPLFTLRSTITPELLSAVARERGLRYMAVSIPFFLVYMFVFDLGFGMYYFAKEGIPPQEFLEWLGTDGNAVSFFFTGQGLSWLIFAVLVGWMAYYRLVFVPRRGARQMKELYPNGETYTFFFHEDCVVLRCESEKGYEEFTLPCADMRRKPQELKTCFLLRTTGKNRWILYKAPLTEEETGQLRAYLQTHCGMRA